jgi:hypothetical protein
MADLMVHEPLSLEELHAETGMVLPERDLMQVNVGVIGGAQANAVFGNATATGIVLTLTLPAP